MITIYYKSVKESDVAILEKFKPGAWLFVERPSNKDLDYLRDELGLDEGLLNDALDYYEVPRLEVNDSSTYIFTRVPARDEDNRSRTVPFLVVIAANFILTLSERPLPFLEKFVLESSQINTTQKTNLFLQIFTLLNKTFHSFLTDINRSVRRDTVQLEQSHAIQNQDVIEFLSFEKTLNDFLAALQPTAVILENLLSGKILKLYEDDKELVEDLFLNTNQLIHLCSSNLKNIVNLRESYSIIVTSNLNRVIKLLTAVTVIITIPTMIASFYGMNVALPYENHPLAFAGIVVATLVISLILLVIFSRKRWF